MGGRGSHDGFCHDGQAGPGFKARDQGVGLVHPAPGQQVGHGFRQLFPDPEGIEDGQRTDPERTVPAKVRNEAPRGQRGGQPAQAPEAFQQHDQPAAHRRGRKFADQRDGHWQLAPQSETHPETAEQQDGQAGREGTQAGGDAVEHHGAHEDVAAAEAVSGPAAGHGAQRHAHEGDTDDPPRLRRCELPLLTERGQHEGHETRVHGVEQPADADESQQRVMETPRGQAIKAGEDIHGSVEDEG